MQTAHQSTVVAALGTTQTLAWASSYYLPAILADDMAAAAGVSRTWVFGAFSASLLLSAFLGPVVGRAIDRHGGSALLVASNLVFAAGLVALSACNGMASLLAAWGLLGIAMALGLYDAAFATLTALYGREARGRITGITLIAGFASTVGWPLSSFLGAEIGWRGTCLVWAAMHVVIGLPLNLLLVPRGQYHSAPKQGGLARREPRREMLLLAYVFAASWFVTGAMAAHLPALLEQMGASATQAVAASALVGPAQVAARLAEFVIMRRAHPLLSARIAASMHPAGAAVLLGDRSAGCRCVRIATRRWEWIAHDRARHCPVGIVWAGRVRGPDRAAWGAGTRRTGRCAAFVRVAPGPDGTGALFVSGGLCLSALAALLLISAHPPARQGPPLDRPSPCAYRVY